MSYIPQPGTIPARVVAWLQQQPAGAQVATGVLCDTLDIDVSLLGGSMQPAIRHGLVTSSKREGRLYWGLATDPAEPQQPDEQRVVDATPPAEKPPAARQAAPLKIPRLAKEPLPKVARQPVDREMRCALWSDGTLVIEQNGHGIELDAAGTRALVRYLEQMAGTGE